MSASSYRSLRHAVLLRTRPPFRLSMNRKLLVAALLSDAQPESKPNQAAFCSKFKYKKREGKQRTGTQSGAAHGGGHVGVEEIVLEEGGAADVARGRANAAPRKVLIVPLCVRVAGRELGLLRGPWDLGRRALHQGRLGCRR